MVHVSVASARIAKHRDAGLFELPGQTWILKATIVHGRVNAKPKSRHGRALFIQADMHGATHCGTDGATAARCIDACCVQCRLHLLRVSASSDGGRGTQCDQLKITGGKDAPKSHGVLINRAHEPR